MVRYTLALAALLSHTSLSNSFAPPESQLAKSRRRRASPTQMRRNLSSSTLYHDDDENDPAKTIQNLRNDVNKLGTAYLDSIQRAVQENMDDEDAYEAEIALKKRMVSERSRTYSIKVPLNPAMRVDGLPLGISLCQVDKGYEFSDLDLDLDTLKYVDASAVEQNSETMNISELKQRLDENFQGVVISGVTKDSLAWSWGVRPGDVLRATSATVGNRLWPKSSLDGVKSAMSSRKVASGEMIFELERGAVDVGSQYELTLTKPLGLQIQETEDGHVEVTGFTANAQKLARFAIKPGDLILSVDSAIGDRFWPVSTVEGVISSCTSRLPGQPIRMQFLRPFGSQAETESREAEMTTASVVVADNSQVVDRASKVASKELLKRCREMLRRYSSGEENSTKSIFSGKYALPSLVADKVLDAVASASASMDSITLSLAMNAYLSCRQPEKAIRAFEAATGLAADGSSNPAIHIITDKEKRGELMADRGSLNLVTGSSLMRAHSLRGDATSVQRVLAALEGRSGAKYGGVGAGEWHGTGVYGSIVPDTQCYNIALGAAVKSKKGDEVDAALELFRTMSEPWQQARKPAKDLISYNTMMGALSKHARPEEAVALFSEMKQAGIRPDKFTYTSLIQACTQPGDMQELLYDMRERGVQPDAVTYNTMIKYLCKRLQLNEAKKLISDMESRGIAPDSMTYGHLMNGLLKAKKPSTCLTLFETACANLRTAPLMENVHLYTTAISAASAVGNHERAFELVSRMNAAGVKPNLKTLTALMGACLSSGKSQLAVDVYKRIDEPDGLAMLTVVRAMCISGHRAEAAHLIAGQRSGTVIMSGKQVMTSFEELTTACLENEDYTLANEVVAYFFDGGYIPSKKFLQSVVEALGLSPQRKNRGHGNGGATTSHIPEEKFDFLLFMIDALQERNLPCEGPFYSSILFAGGRMGGLRRKLASLMSEARVTTRDFAIVNSEDTNAEAKPVVKWQDLAQKYDEQKKQLADGRLLLPRLMVRMSSKEVRQVLAAEQRVSYGSRARQRKPASRVQLAYNEPASS